MGQVVRLEDHRPEPEPKPTAERRHRRRFGKVRQLGSGRWQASYIGPDLVRHVAPTTFVNKGDAGKWLSLQESAIIRHKWEPPQVVKPTLETFGDYGTRWLAGADLKPRTRDEYRRLLDALAPTFAKVPLTAMTPELVEAWHAELPEDREWTNAHLYVMLHRVMQAAVDDDKVGGVRINPCQHPRWGRVTTHKPIKPATVAEIATIAEHMPPGLAAAVHVAAWTGLRLGELAELRRRDVDLQAGLIRVTRAVGFVAGEKREDGTREYAPAVTVPKSAAGLRTVALPPHVAALLAAHLDAHTERGADALVFTSPTGLQLRSATVHRYYGKARKAAGREDLRWHDLRHTGATMYAEAGATLKESMAYLGHGTARMALHYQHVADDRPAALAAKLSAMAGWEAPNEQ